jgi:hypothetical protein
MRTLLSSIGPWLCVSHLRFLTCAITGFQSCGYVMLLHWGIDYGILYTLSGL